MNVRVGVYKLCPNCGKRWPAIVTLYGRKSYRVECSRCNHEFEHGTFTLRKGVKMPNTKVFTVLNEAEVDELIRIVKEGNDHAL